MKSTQQSVSYQPLFEPLDSKPKHRAAETSVEAYKQVRGQLPARALKVLALLQDRSDGLTDEEIADHFGWLFHGVAAVTGRTLYRQHGLIVDSGEKRPNKSGAMARVWKIKNQTEVA